MRVMIVESNRELAAIWGRHLARQGLDVQLVTNADQAIERLEDGRFDVIVANLFLESGSALALADVLAYRSPDSSIIFVTDTSFFSDGSIFAVTPNARALVQSSMKPDDLVALVEHYGSRAQQALASSA